MSALSKPSAATVAMLLLMSSLAGRAADSTKIFTVSTEAVRFIDDEKLDMLISESCRTANGSYSCKAMDAAAQASLAPVSNEPRPGGAEKGARICRLVGGTVVLGRDENKNEISLCKFADASLIGNSSLYRAAADREAKTHKATGK